MSEKNPLLPQGPISIRTWRGKEARERGTERRIQSFKLLWEEGVSQTEIDIEWKREGRRERERERRERKGEKEK